MKASIGLRTQLADRTTGSCGTYDPLERVPGVPLAARFECGDRRAALGQLGGGRPIVGLAGKVAGDQLEQVGNPVAVAVLVGDGLDPRRDARRLARLS